jgi:hypothetical protein
MILTVVNNGITQTLTVNTARPGVNLTISQGRGPKGDSGSPYFIPDTANGTADYTATTQTLLFLADLAGKQNRVVNLPTPTNGRPLRVCNRNASAFKWSFAGVNVFKLLGGQVTDLDNTSIYSLAGNGTSYDIIN